MSKTAIAHKPRKEQIPSGKSRAIVEAAARVFLEMGYGAASMDAIAAEAGVSKQTVYSYFGSKEALFEAIIEVKCDELMAPGSLKLVPGQDHAEALTDVARRFLTLVLADPNSALFRVVVAESVRFPELAEAFYRAGPTTATETLAGYLADLGDQGVLAIADATAAAKLFFAMLRGDLYMRRLLGLTPEPPAADIEAVVDQAVTAFLAAHARV